MAKRRESSVPITPLTLVRRKGPTMNPSARLVAWIPRDAYVEGHGYRVSFVVEGETFHRPTGAWPYTGVAGETMPWFWGHDYDEAVKLADDYNRNLGIAPREAALIVARSMAGPGRTQRSFVNGTR